MCEVQLFSLFVESGTEGFPMLGVVFDFGCRSAAIGDGGIDLRRVSFGATVDV